MSNSFLNNFDRLAHRAFKSAKLSSIGSYTPPADDAVEVENVRVYIDRDVEVYGDQLNMIFRKVVINILKDDVPMPEVGGIIVIDSESFTLEAKNSEDESLTGWVVL